ncbi:MAG: hypothetical protein IANPNBLG_03243 [Bryobacteraceae bacterium]|nr:hypothetical protein [Bryobacteraceae bacterium]
MPVHLEDLAHKIADRFAAALIKHEDRRARPAQRAPEKAGRAEAESLLQPRNQFGSVGLMETVLEGGGERAGGSRGKRGDQKCRPLDIEHRVGARINRGKHGARLRRGQFEVRHNHRHAIARGQFQAHGPRHPSRIDGAGDDRPQHRRRHVIRMPFNLCRLIQNPQRLPAKPQQFIGDHHARRQSRRARAQPLAERNLIVDLELDGRQRLPVKIASHLQRRLPDQIVLARRNGAGVPPRAADAQFAAPAEAAYQGNIERQSESIEAGTEVRARCRYA